MDNISNIIVAVAAVVGAIVAALVGGITIWTFRDIRSRSRDILVQILATVMVAVVPVAGIVVYFMLRPRETLQEGYVRALEEESLLASIEHQEFCPTCGRRVDVDMQFCPSCHTKLRNPCGNCGRAVHLSWELCPYCGNELTPEMPTVNVRRTMKPRVAGPGMAGPGTIPKTATMPIGSRQGAPQVAGPRSASLPNSEAAKARLSSLLDRVGGAIDSVASKAQQRMNTPNAGNGSAEVNGAGDIDGIDDGFVPPQRTLPAKKPVNGSGISSGSGTPSASPSTPNGAGSPPVSSFRRPPPNTPRRPEEDELE